MPSDPKNRPRVPTGSDDFEDEATQVGDFGLRHATAPSAKHDRPYLIVISGETLGRMYRIDQVETVLGRGAEAGVRLTDDGISRKHAVLVRRGDQLWLEDLKSANGTRVNGESIQGRVVKDGDQIQVGDATILKLTYSDELEEAFQKNMYDAALRDGLTKAFNKHHFLERLPSEVAYARRHGTPLSLTMLDVDLVQGGQRRAWARRGGPGPRGARASRDRLRRRRGFLRALRRRGVRAAVEARRGGRRRAAWPRKSARASPGRTSRRRAVPHPRHGELGGRGVLRCARQRKRISSPTPTALCTKPSAAGETGSSYTRAPEAETIGRNPERERRSASA